MPSNILEGQAVCQRKLAGGTHENPSSHSYKLHLLQMEQRRPIWNTRDDIQYVIIGRLHICASNE